MSLLPLEKHRVRILAPLLAALAFLLLTLLVLGHLGVLYRSDAAISEAAHDFTLAHSLWRSMMSAITHTGTTVVLGPLACVACVALLRWRRWRAAVFVAVAMLVTVGIRMLIVVNVARPRPNGWLTTASGWSFPSGHTTAAAAFALIMVLTVRPLLRRRYRRWLAGVAGTWAVLVGVSRVALTVHWPSDVLGGWLLALTIVPAIAFAAGVLPDSGPQDAGNVGES